MAQSDWTPEKVARLIADTNYFNSPLSVSAVEALLKRGRIVSYNKGQVILQRQLEAPKFFLALSGTVRLTAHTMDGREYVSYFTTPGNMWGVHPSLGETSETHDAVAETDCEVCVLAAADIRELMWENREIQEVLIEILCKRLKLALGILEQFATWGPKERLAWRIHEIAKSMGGKPSENSGMRIRIAQDAMASMIGLSRQRTNMLLKEFEQIGALRIEYGAIRILDLERLEACIGELPN